MSEWTPGPWHEERGVLLNAKGIIVCDPWPSLAFNPQDEPLIAKAPEMAELLGLFSEDIKGPEPQDDCNCALGHRCWAHQAAALLAEIREA